MYYLEGKGVFAVLPYEVTEKDDEEVVIRADEAAEEADELNGVRHTMMESMSMSIL